MGKLGQLLVARGWITVQQLTRALQNQNAVGGRLGTCLLEMEVLGEDLLARSLSEQLGAPAANIEDLRGIPDQVLHLIPEKLARRCRAIPFRAAGGRLDVAMQDPRNLVCQDEIAFACGRRVKVHVLHELRIYEALQRYFREECPSRFSLLLDRLNRARYLWATPGGGGRAAQASPPGTSAAAAEESAEVLSMLPADHLLGGPPRMDPPPLPEPELPPLPRRRSLFRSRGAAAPGAAPAPPLRGGDLGKAGEPPLPPLEQLDLRAPPRRQRELDSERQGTAACAAGTDPAAAGASAPAIEAAGISSAESLETAEMAAPDGTAAAAIPAMPAAAASAFAAAAVGSTGAAAAAGAPDLEATAQLGPPRPSLPSSPPTRKARYRAGEPATAAPAPEAAVVRHREAEAPHQRVTLTDAERAELELDAAHPAAPPVPVREAPATLGEVEAAFAHTTDLQEVGRILLGFLARSYRRVALFQATRRQVIAWMAHGDGIDQEAFARYQVDFDQPSVFLNLRQGSGIHLGALPPMQTHRELALCWGGGLPRDCVVLPVRLKDRLVTAIYVDGGSRGLWGIELEQMQRLTAATAAAFERCILGKKRGYAQS